MLRRQWTVSTTGGTTASPSTRNSPPSRTSGRRVAGSMKRQSVRAAGTATSCTSRQRPGSADTDWGWIRTGRGDM